MPADLDLFRNLPQASFRGIGFPVSSRERRHAHEHAKHALQYRGEKLIETTGGDNWVYTYTIPFRQGIAIGGYKDLFTSTWKEFWAAYENPATGTLVDPISGPVQVKPASWDEPADINKRDGVDVTVSFIESPDIDEDGAIDDVPTLQGALSDAGKLDAEVEKTFREAEEPAPEPATDPLSAIAGVGAQINRAPGKVAAKLHDTSDRCDKIDKECEKLRDPETTAQVSRSARRLRLKSTKLAEEAQNPARTVRVAVVNADKAASAAASELGMTLEEFLKLNPSVTRTLRVLAGSSVRYYGE